MTSSSKPTPPSALAHGVAGTIGGVSAMALLYPLENLRLRLQVKDTSETPNQSVMEVFREIVEAEGVAGFYQGIESSLLGVAVSSGVYFFLYSAFKKLALASSQSRTLSPGANMLVASLAGVVNVFATNPFWTVSSQVIIGGGRQSMLECSRSIFRKSGIRGFYAGLNSSLLLVSNPIIQFVSYEQLSIFVKLASGSRSALEIFLLGAIAKALATVATYPIQVVKSRLQVSGADGVKQYSGSREVLQHILKIEGLLGLYKGLSAKITQSVLNSAFTFLVYESILKTVVSLMAIVGTH